jgi:hypothetical protein
MKERDGDRVGNGQELEPELEKGVMWCGVVGTAKCNLPRMDRQNEGMRRKRNVRRGGVEHVTLHNSRTQDRVDQVDDTYLVTSLPTTMDDFCFFAIVVV